MRKLIPDRVKEKVLNFFKNIPIVLVSNRLRAIELNTPFFVVAMPGSLHVIKLCLMFVPADQEVVMVLNGLDPWEKEWAKRHFNIKGFINFPIKVGHAMVINYLLDWMEQPFGLLDSDCFVFCGSYFERIKNFPKNASVSSWYGFKNEKSGLFLPYTFFIFINTPVIKRIIKWYGVDACRYRWDQLPAVAQNKMKEIGISGENSPVPSRPGFDTLMALEVLSLAENYQFFFPEGYATNYSTNLTGDIFHVGGVSSVYRGVKIKNRYDTRGSYFWNRALEETNEREVQAKYHKKYAYSSSKVILEQFPNARENIGDDFFKAVERVIGYC